MSDGMKELLKTVGGTLVLSAMAMGLVMLIVAQIAGPGPVIQGPLAERANVNFCGRGSLELLRQWVEAREVAGYRVEYQGSYVGGSNVNPYVCFPAISVKELAGATR